MAARLDALTTVDVSSKLRDVEVSILYLRATKDQLVGESHFQQIANVAERVQLAEFEVPHFLLQTVPGAAAAAVRAFINSSL